MLEAKIFYFLNRQVVRNWVVFTTPHFPPWNHQQSSSNWDTVALLTEQWTSPILVYDRLSKFLKQRQRIFLSFLVLSAFNGEYAPNCGWLLLLTSILAHSELLVHKGKRSTDKSPKCKKITTCKPLDIWTLLRLKIWEASETLSEYQAKTKKYMLDLVSIQIGTILKQMLVKISNCDVMYIQGTPILLR